VADAVGADIEEVFDPVTPGPIAQDLGLQCGLAVFRGRDMIDDGLDTIGVEDVILPLVDQIHDGDRGGDLVAENDVKIKNHGIFADVIAEMGGEDLFGDCFSHSNSVQRITGRPSRTGASLTPGIQMDRAP